MVAGLAMAAQRVPTLLDPSVPLYYVCRTARVTRFAGASQHALPVAVYVTQAQHMQCSPSPKHAVRPRIHNVPFIVYQSRRRHTSVSYRSQCACSCVHHMYVTHGGRMGSVAGKLFATSEELVLVDPEP